MEPSAQTRKEETYAAFGMCIRSDRPLPLPEAIPPEATDSTRLSPAVVLQHRDGLADPAPRLEPGTLTDRGVVLRYGGWWLDLEPDRGTLSYEADPEAPLELPLFHVAERCALPIYAVLADRGRIALHASGVALDGEAWLFVAPTGTGKSSTAYELVHRFGGRALSDEMAVVDVEAERIEAGAPAFRLDRPPGSLPEAVDDGAIHAEASKRWFRLELEHIASGRPTLNGIVRLERLERRSAQSRNDSGAATDFDWERLRGREALTTLLDDTFDFEASPPPWRRRRFRAAARLARTTPVYRAVYEATPSGTPEHVDPLADHLGARS